MRRRAGGTGLRFLNPAETRIYWGGDGSLRVEVGGLNHTVSRVARAFPLTAPGKYIALLDEEEREIGWVEEVDRLDRASAEALRRALERAYFIPVITRILDLREEYGVYVWETETDRGPRTFEVTSRHHVREVQPGHVVVKDAYGNLYDIPDITSLDDQSRTLLDPLI